jgi:hypothetical protein
VRGIWEGIFWIDAETKFQEIKFHVKEDICKKIFPEKILKTGTSQKNFKIPKI